VRAQDGGVDMAATGAGGTKGSGGAGGAGGAGGTILTGGGGSGGAGTGGTTGAGGSAGGSGGAGGTTGAGGSAGGGGGSAGGSGGASAGAGGVGAGAGGSGAGGGATDGGSCLLLETVVGQSATLPTVFLLVDRSGSMFGCVGSDPGSLPCADQTNTPWAVLRTGVLNVVNNLQGSVRFGFGAFTGTNGGTCPIFTQVPAAIDNYTAIATVYNALGALPTKAETPVGPALALTASMLAADPTSGPKYILFVTDGQPDFCDDGDPVCPTDSVVGHLQALKTSGITTLIFGVQAGSTTSVPLATLQAFANAGAGQPVMQLTNPASNTAAECMSSVGWHNEYVASGKTGNTPLGSYATAGGSAMVYQPNPGDEQALETLLATTIAGVKSCTFDLANGFSVDLTKLDQAQVLIDSVVVPLDPSNGWHMLTGTRLELAGNACALWRQPSTRMIDFRFPCDIILTGP
jgi:hypothetical protein